MMIVSNKKDVMHKVWLYRLLMAIYNTDLKECLYFKGGTCAAMLGYLNRFSVDLDFDYDENAMKIDSVKSIFEEIFENLNLGIKDSSQRGLQYFLKYPASNNERSTVKIDTNFPFNKNNKYKISKFKEINKFVKHQSIETMFANKMLALIGRWEEGKSIAGRDIYDVHYFFTQGFVFDKDVIIEVRQTDIDVFIKELIVFIEKEITQTIIDQDVNLLVPEREFKKVRLRLKDEVLFYFRGIC